MLYDFGPKVSESISDFFKEDSTQVLLNKLEQAGIEIKDEKTKNVKQNLLGLKFIFTGEMNSLSRSEAQEKVKLLGGIPKEFMSRDIDYVVVGENPGSKLEKAKELGIKMINENEFNNLIK